MTNANNTENIVTSHYEGSDRLKRARALAENPAPLTQPETWTYDELHVGGHPETIHFMKSLDLRPDLRVLDIGSGLGGAARYAATQYQAHIDGVDLTAGFCDVAGLLSAKTGLAALTQFHVGSALDLPFPDATFDRAYTIHTCMNIDDKATLCAEAFRALKPGGLFGIYDVMRGDNTAPLAYPLPWSDEPAASFLATPDDMRAHLQKAGFTITAHEDRTESGIAALHRMKEKTPEFYTIATANLLEALKSGQLVAMRLTARKPA